MPGAGLTNGTWAKALSDKPAFQPYWGKPAVRNDRGDGGNVGIIRSPLRATVLPDRLPFALIVGYSLHGLWDLLHELQAHGAYSAFEPGKLTAIPLAYGFFCAAFDFSMAAYFYTRRAALSAAWNTSWWAL
jgi:hypothetical protein